MTARPSQRAAACGIALLAAHACGALILAMLIALSPTAKAFATPSAGQTFTVKNGTPISYKKYGHSFRFHTAEDGTIVYCVQMNVNGGDDPYDTKVSSQRVTGQVGYVLYHGYPRTRTISGTTWSETDARAITQLAIWVFTDSSGNTDSSLLASLYEPYRTAIRSLVTAANNWAKSSSNTSWAPENNYALKCYPISKEKQNMIVTTGLLEGSATLKKTSTDQQLTLNNPDYSLEGAIYSVYKSDGKTGTSTYFYVDANGSGTLRKWVSGKSPNPQDPTTTLPAGSYRIREYRAPKGYNLDTNTYTLNITGLQTSNLNVSDKPLYPGSLSLSKTSSMPAITDGHPCYSLAGAEYGVYSDSSCTTPVGTLTTDDQGNTEAIKVWEGTYWVKETKASPGFLLDETIYTVSVGAGEDAVLTCKETPALEPISLVAQKNDKDTGAAEPQGDASLEGAEFTLAYYAGDYEEGELPEEPTRSWVLRTGSDGSATLDAEHKVTGDEFYLSDDGKAVLPLGTISIYETRAPEGYRITDDTHAIRRIRYSDSLQQIETHIAPLEMREEVQRGGLKLLKANEQGEGLSGAEFSVTNSSEAAVVVDGTSYEPGEVCLTITSDEQGVAVTAADALPYGTYTIAETRAPRGYHLNEDWKETISIHTDGTIEDISARPCTDTPVTIEIPLSATKRFDGENQGRELEDGLFSFTLSDEQGTVLQTKTNDAEGSVHFDPISYDFGKLGAHTYTIKEVMGTDEEIVYDTHEETVTVTISAPDDWSLAADVVTDDDGVVFENKTVEAVPMPLTGGAGLAASVPRTVMTGLTLGLLLLRFASTRHRA